jgi:hypothetical protein
MRIISLLLLVCLICQNISAQTTTRPPLTKADYLQKSKSHKITGFVLLGTGFLSSGVGLIVGIASSGSEFVEALGGPESNGMEIGGTLFYAGLAAMAGSIPFFISSSKNKKKASSLSGFLKMENRPLLYQNNLSKLSYPAIGLKITL